LPELLVLLLLLSAGWLLWSNLRAREAANAAMRATCRTADLLFLDDTVALDSVRPARDADGRVRLRWIYRFEYSDTGRNRRPGRVTVLGAAVESVEIGSAPPAVL
jgi:hypothetical protein